MKKLSLIFVAGLASLPFIAFATETISYTYDSQGRLVTALHSGDINNSLESNYTFDDSDNRHNVKITNAH